MLLRRLPCVGVANLSRGPLVMLTNNFSSQKHKKVLLMAKGYRGRANSCYKIALRRVEKALQYAYRDRKVKKRDFRSQWIERINAASRQHDMAYSRLIAGMSNANIELNRKVLADIAVTEPLSFTSIIATVKQPY